MHADGQARFSRSLHARVDAAGGCARVRGAFRLAVGVQVTCARGGVGRREARRQGVERQRVPAGSAHRGGRNLEQRRREARHDDAQLQEGHACLKKTVRQLCIFALGLLPVCCELRFARLRVKVLLEKSFQCMVLADVARSWYHCTALHRVSCPWVMVSAILHSLTFLTEEGR